MAIVGVTFGALAVLAVFGYVAWGWTAVFSRAYYPELDFELGPEGRAEARAATRRAVRWASVCKCSGWLFGGMALACGAFAGRRERRAWRAWPWPSLVCLVPSLFALGIAFLGDTAPALQHVAFAVKVVSFFAALFDLWRLEPDAASRPLSWTVFVVSLLALLVRPFRGW